MRNSSMKSIVAALSIAATLVIAVPTATAGPVRTQETQNSGVGNDSSNDRFAAVRQLVIRVLRRIGVQSGPSIPIPK